MPLPTTPLKERLASGELILCVAFSQARTADMPMMAAACGFDSIYVDLEHTATSLETASMLCTAAIGFGLFPLVRVPSHDHQYMTRAIDTGALGLIVPHVDTRAQAQHIVDTCRFPPVGRRSIIGTNPATRYLPMKPTEVVEHLDRHTLLSAMLETPAAIENAVEIAGVPGIDLLLIGSFDLSAELGILGQFRHARFLDAVANAAKACRAAGKVLGIAGIRDPELLGELVAQGVRFISAGNDAGFFMEAAQAQVNRLRAIPVPAGPGPAS
jgi:2-keto-3-deoxy-L-rhamnonate aldolase RhmA